MDLANFKNEKPTKRWNECMIEGDDIFAEENIMESEKALDIFIDELISLGNSPGEHQIIRCVEKVVLKFNELNENYDYYIETLEREELCEFIDKAVKAVGLNADYDITEEWRDW
jgi:hypothetical protein